jgi:hypothetical protein
MIATPNSGTESNPAMMANVLVKRGIYVTSLAPRTRAIASTVWIASRQTLRGSYVTQSLSTRTTHLSLSPVRRATGAAQSQQM